MFPTKTHTIHHQENIHTNLAPLVVELPLDIIRQKNQNHYLTSDHVCTRSCAPSFPEKAFIYNQFKSILLSEGTKRKKLPEIFLKFAEDDILDRGRKPAGNIANKYWRQKKAFYEYYKEDSLASVLYALLEHKYGFSYVQQFLTQNVLDELTENITERFYQSLY